MALTVFYKFWSHGTKFLAVTETVLPNIYERTRQKVESKIKEAKVLSFTSDLWSTTVSVNSLMSLTAHWLDGDFKQNHAVLHVQEFDGSHTGEAIKEKFLNMFEKWDISHEQIHIVLRDNGTNIVKALNDASLPHYGCFAHSLQLVVHDGVLSQRAVII